MDITVDDLPKPDVGRWVASRKEAVVKAVRSGLISLETALMRYKLTPEEYEGWAAGFDQAGRRGLKVTKLQERRPRRQ